MTRKFKVIALSVGADSGKIFYADEIVSEDAWLDTGRADELVKEGFLEEYTEDIEDSGTKHILTDDDLIGNPGLVSEGLKIGDEVTLPKEGFTVGAKGKKSNPRK